jgi:nitrogen fixation protein
MHTAQNILIRKRNKGRNMTKQECQSAAIPETNIQELVISLINGGGGGGKITLGMGYPL